MTICSVEDPFDVFITDRYVAVEARQERLVKE
jgi:hypothetical protein